ncbi:helicase-related protein, partial [Dysgonomonas termitidis]
RAIRQTYDRSADSLNKYFGEDAPQAALAFNKLVDNSSEEELKQELLSVVGDERLDDNGKRAIVEYVTACSAYSGMNKAKQEDIQQAEQQMAWLADENINLQMNAVVSAVIAGNGNPVQVTGGNIVQREDGSIDSEASDKQIFYVDAEGNKQVTSIDFIESIGENIPAQDAIAQLIEMETANIISRQENEEVREYQPGETVTADVAGNGITFTGEVTGITQSGNYIIVSPVTGEQVEAEPRHIINQDNIQGVENGSLVEYRNERGERVQGTVNDAYGLRPQGMMDIDGNGVPVAGIIGLVSQLTVNSKQLTQESDNLQATTPESADNLQATGQQNKDIPAGEQDNLTPAGQIPKDEKGNLLFEQAPVEATIGALSEVYNDTAELSGVVDATIGNIRKQIDKAKAPKPTGDINKDIAGKRAANQQLEELNNRLSYWEEVRKAIQESKPLRQQITEQLTNVSNDNNISFNEPENNEKRVELGDSIFTPDNSSVPDETAGDEAEKSSPAFGANNKLVSTERYEELKKRMRDKLNNLNIGIDPELFAIGAEMAVYNIEAGARKFADFAGRMIDDLGDNIRPYLKAFYEGARQMPGMETIREEMDSFQIVNSFDVDSIRTGEEASPINREEIESFAGVLANDILSRPESLEKYFNNDRQKQDIVFDSLFGSAMLNHRKEHVSAYKQFVEHEEFSRELKNKVKSLLNEYGQRRKNEKPVTGNAETIVRELNNHYLRSGLDTEKEQEEAAGHPAESEQRLTPAFDEEKPINGTDILTGGDDFIKNHIVTGTIAKTDVQTRQDSNKNNTGRLPDRMRQSAGGMDDRAPAGGTVPDDAGRYAERLPEQDRTGRDEGGEADDKQRDESGGSRVPGHQQGGTALRPDGDGRTGTGGRTAEPRKDTGSGGIPGDHPVLNRNNFRTGDKDNIVPKGAVSKIRANIKAIGLLKKLEEEGRDATDNEKQILSQYSGWGGLAEVLNTTRKGESSWREKYGEYHDRIISLLTPEEFTAAENSTINAHYTSGGIIAEMWKLAERLGFKGGRVLEPALGTGNFFGLMPEHISSKSSLRAYELDSITGRIAAKLYPDARIQVKGYEESKDRDTDLIITNVPFGQKAPYDSANRDICDFSLHNYFIAKGIKQLAPGGLGLFITSKSTMDSAASAKLREWVTTKGYADLIGAIRLPNTAFSENAGTEVTTDILVFRKRDSEKPGRYAKDFRFTNDIKEVKMRDGSPTVIEANEYFAQNPDMMLGELKLAYEDNKGGLYSGDDVTLAPHRGQDLIKALDEAIRSFPAGISDIENANFNEKAESGEKEGTMVDRDGHIYEVIDGELSVPGWINENTTTVRNKKVPRVKVARHYLRIKDIAGKLIDAEREDKDNIEELRAELNREYDSFYNEYGRFNDNIKLRFLVDTDVEYNTVFALEKVKRIKEVDSQGNEKTITDIGKADIFSKRILFPVREPVQADNIADALEISLSYRGSLDLNYIAGLTGLSADEAKEKLRDEGLAFTNPSTSLLEDRDSYLSGYVRSKYYEALEAARTEPEFERNVKALEPVIPKDIPGTQIKIRLGSTFIPDKYYEEFAREKLKADAKIAYRPELNKYVVQLNSGRDSAENKTTYGTSYFSGIQLIEKGLNLKQPVAFDIFYEGGQPKRIKNQEKTAEAQAMLSSIADLFVNYIYDNEQAMSEIERVYNDKYNDYVEKSYSVPGIVHYPGANKDITLRQHQKRAVSRGLRDSVLLAHQVGTGKTFTKITIAMEMRRLGIAKKPMIAVQNATLEQYVASFRALYPGANILAPTKKMMDAKNRTRLFSLIAYGDYDAVIIPHSFLYMIPDDPQRQRDYLNEQIAELQNVLSDVNEDQDRVLHEELTRKIEQLQESLDEIDNPGKEKKSKKGKKVKDKAKKQLGVVRRITRQADRRTDNVLTFEKMGVDALIVDEAHNFKRLGLITKMGSVKGIDTSGSKRAYGVYMKVRYIHERTGGKNIVFATGTPITNTMAEAWTMMRYIEPDVLEKYDIGSFDRFATTFGSVEPSLEFTATGNFKVVDRFKSFINAPELFTAFRVKADVVLTEDIPEFKEGNTIPKLKGGSFTQVIVPQSSLLVEVMNQLKDKMKWWENLSPREKKKNRSVPIVVFGRAKQAAIDLRLINPALPDDPESKTNRVIAEVKRIYDASSHYRGTQLIFSDLFQSSAKIPGKRFNLYEDIKEKLVALGIPEHEVAIIHDYDEKNREKLFERVNEGLVRIVIGNTEKMGVGVNMQKRAVALHHIDAPARPMDFEQRNGRILRQGNLHAQMGIPVEVLTYGVEKTLDATAYQRLAIKQSFINQVMKGDSLDREISDEAEEDSPSDMDFMQMMAVLSGSKYAQLHFLKSAELKKLETAERNHLRRQVEINKQIKDYTVYKEYREVELETLNRVKSLLDTYFPEGKITSVTINGKKQDEKLAVAIDEAINDYKKTFVSALKTHMEMPALEVRFNSYPQAMELDYIDLINDNFRYFYKTGDYAMKGMIQTGAGLLNSLRSRIANIPGEIQEAKDKIGFYGTNIPVLKSELLKPFDKGEKLEHLRKEIAEIAEKMKAEVVTDKKEASATGRTIDSSMIDLEATEEGEDGEVVSYGNEGEKANGTDYRSNEEDGEEDEETEDTVYPGEEKDVNNTDIEETQEGIIDTVSPYKHTQTGQLFYLARIKAQVPAPVFSGLKDKAKSLNGSWSRFAKGFLFEDESKANEFRNRANSSGDIRRQALSSGSFRSITAERFGRLIDKLNRTGLAVDVVSDEDIRNNPEIKDTQGNVYGYVTPDGVIHLDVTRMNANTPVHEFGHLWNSFIKENNPELWKKGVELIKESDYWQRVNDIPAYKNLSEEAKVDEALAMAIGDKGESVFHKQNDLSLYMRVKGWLYDVWSTISKKLGISPGKRQVTIEDMSLSDFTDRAVRDLFGGERLVDNPVQSEETRMQSVNDIATATNSAMTAAARRQLDGRLKN